MEVTELNREQMIELKTIWYDNYLYENEGRGLSYGEASDIDTFVSDDVIFEEYKNTTFSNDDFNCTAGREEYIYVDYDTWADGEDGWTVNDVRRYVDEKYLLDADDEDDILQTLVNHGMLEKTDGYEVDYSCSPDYLEIYEKEECKPIGRFELVA